MVLQMRHGKEVVHLWLAIAVIVVLSAYRVSVHLIDQLRGYFLPYITISVGDLLTNLLFVWLVILLWLAYSRWRQAIRREMELEQVISGISPDVLMVVTPDRVIRMCNDSIRQMFGYEPEEVIGRTTDLLYFDRRLVGEKGEISKVLKKFGFHVGRATGRRKDQGQFPLEIITGDVSGQPGAVVLMRDITERNRVEEALRISHEKQQEVLRKLRDTQRQVIQQERLRVLGQMASYIAHEFNNALTPILGFTELLLSQPDILDERKTATGYLEDVHTAAKDAAAVVKRLREFYALRDTTVTLSPVQLNDVINESISLTRPKWKGESDTIGRTITIHTELAELPAITGSREELHEVLANLIFNAVGAMADGGTITITTRRDGDYVVLEVSDTGKGMTEETSQRCMDPFFTTMGTEGTGLGLVVVSSIIQRHQGTVSFESKEDEGTRFTITLPVAPLDMMFEKPETPLVHPKSLHVLVVDDEPLVRKLMARHLTADGHTVESAGTGKAGLEAFQVGRFDAILTDWAMPGMNGSQLAGKIRKQDAIVPIIMMTGFDSGLRDTSQTDTGIDFIIGKPITRAILRQTIHQAQQLSEGRRAQIKIGD